MHNPSFYTGSGQVYNQNTRNSQNLTPQATNPFNSSSNFYSRTPGSLNFSNAANNQMGNGPIVTNPISSAGNPFNQNPINTGNSSRNLVTGPNLASANPFSSANQLGSMGNNANPFSSSNQVNVGFTTASNLHYGPNNTSQMGNTQNPFSNASNNNPFSANISNSAGFYNNTGVNSTNFMTNPINSSNFQVPFSSNPIATSNPASFFVNPTPSMSLSNPNSLSNALNTSNFYTNSSQILPNNSQFGPHNTQFVSNSSQLLTNPNSFNIVHSPSLQFEEPGSWRHKKIEDLNENFRGHFYNLQKEFDKIDESVKSGQGTLSKFDEALQKVNEKCREVLSYTRKVTSLQKRVKISLEIKQKFENKVSKYLKEFIKMCDHCSSADSFRQITAPAEFLHDFLELCNKRLDSVEESIGDIEEIIKNECEKENLNMLVQIIVLMQERFKIVAAETFDMHSRVTKFLNSMPKQIKDINNYVHHLDSNYLLENKAEIRGFKENTPPSIIKNSNIKDVISGRINYFNK